MGLPTDYARPGVQGFAGARHGYWLDPQVASGLKGLCQGEGVTLYMACLAAYQVLLAKYSGQEEVVVGTAVAGREHPEGGGGVGLFVNTLALRSSPERRESFRAGFAGVEAGAGGGRRAHAHPV